MKCVCVYVCISSSSVRNNIINVETNLVTAPLYPPWLVSPTFGIQIQIPLWRENERGRERETERRGMIREGEREGEGKMVYTGTVSINNLQYTWSAGAHSSIQYYNSLKHALVETLECDWLAIGTKGKTSKERGRKRKEWKQEKEKEKREK